MKHIIYLFAFFVFFGMPKVFSQKEWIAFDQTNRKGLEINNVRSTSTQIDFQLVIHGMYIYDSAIGYYNLKRIEFPGNARYGLTGHPELPFISKLVAIPDCDSLTVSIEVIDSLLFSEYLIYPVPEYIIDSITGNNVEVFKIDSIFYQQNVDNPRKSTFIEKSGSVREQKIALLNFFPAKYNPVTKVLKVYNSVNIKITFFNPNGNDNVDVGLFGNVLNKSLLNYSINSRRAISTSSNPTSGVTWYSGAMPNQMPVDYLIVANDNFVTPFHSSALTEFAEYRANKSAVEVGIVDVKDILVLCKSKWVNLPKQT